MADSIDTEDVEFYNPHDTLKRETGVYLDYQERVHAEEQRAVREGREPDFDNMPAATGTPLVTRESLPLVPIASAPEPIQTLPVATDANGEGYDTGSDEHNKMVAEANKARDGEIRKAALSTAKAESAAAKAAAESRLENVTKDLNQTAAQESTVPRATPREVKENDDARKNAATAKKASASKKASVAVAPKKKTVANNR